MSRIEKLKAEAAEEMELAEDLQRMAERYGDSDAGEEARAEAWRHERESQRLLELALHLEESERDGSAAEHGAYLRSDR